MNSYNKCEIDAAVALTTLRVPMSCLRKTETANVDSGSNNDEEMVSDTALATVLEYMTDMINMENNDDGNFESQNIEEGLSPTGQAMLLDDLDYSDEMDKNECCDELMDLGFPMDTEETTLNCFDSNELDELVERILLDWGKLHNDISTSI